jgi:hypothetical protein
MCSFRVCLIGVEKGYDGIVVSDSGNPVPVSQQSGLAALIDPTTTIDRLAGAVCAHRAGCSA